MDQSSRLSLSYVAPSQAQKHVTVNETFRRLDALTQASVRSRTVTAEPGAPDEGDMYILPSGATGASWENFTENNIAAYQDGAWVEITIFEGFRVWVDDDDAFVVFNGGAWAALTGGASETALKFGVNATADATNRLSVKSDAVLFSHDDLTPGSGDAQVKVNKAASGDTASHLFQTNFSGRAEFGLTGDDDFHLKVSPDGSSWNEALFVDKDTALSGFGTAAPGTRIHVYGTNAMGSRLTVERSGSGAGVFGALNGLFVGATEPLGTAGVTFWTTDSGGADNKRLELFNDGSLVVGAPTGGAKGTGTINAQSVYDDNALLSCYVFDQAIDGAIDRAKWDARTPEPQPGVRKKRTLQSNDKGKDEIVELLEAVPPAPKREHAPMRKFARRIGGTHDPLTLDGYARHWKEKRHLTSMPNEAAFDVEKGMAAGAWIQRLVETVEIQAVLIEELNQRIKNIEAR
ncbi:DUF2793 domain-containing protein [Hyphococcus flavus]|uniref:DUF2793 domain-containing protein n=1 Tax=Hyphococcus flavus TaxID=1866326 RepID=A0AAE9ZEY8_9PROT|nr:DUF2793 domain-containing protein [Hyphococcus flavus]WDI32510.1 DUF2793 domain-containing protein [Hyphococcus flavus]